MIGMESAVPAVPPRVVDRPGAERTAIVVLGMHRSGTSAFTRTINLLGVDLPERLLDPVPGDNDRGYWEAVQVVALHDLLLQELSSDWFDPLPVPDGFFETETARHYEERIVNYLTGAFPHSREFVLKDPRICRLVPLWARALRRVGAEPHFIVTLRNPLDVAASLQRRNGTISDDLAAQLWLGYTLDAFWYTRGEKRTVACYDELLDDWRETVDRIGGELGMSWPASPAGAAAGIEGFLSPELRHHRSHGFAEKGASPFVSKALQVFDVLAARPDDAVCDAVVERERAAHAVAGASRPVVAHLFREYHRRYGTRTGDDLHDMKRRLAAAEEERDRARRALVVSRRRLAAFRRWTGVALVRRLLRRF